MFLVTIDKKKIPNQGKKEYNRRKSTWDYE